MRVIAQNGCADIDYETSSFSVEREDPNSDFEIMARTLEGHTYLMACYSTNERAIEELLKLSSSYKRYFITTKDNKMQMTDAIECEMDMPFESFTFKEVEATAYRFAEDNSYEPIR